MSDHSDPGSRQSFEAAVRSFTEAEVALGEFVAAAQRFRSASESIERAQAGLELTREPVVEAIATLHAAIAVELQGTATAMRSSAEVLAQLEPDRFWTTFAELRGATDRASAANETEHVRLIRLAEPSRILAAASLAVALASLGGIVLLLLR